MNCLKIFNENWELKNMIHEKKFVYYQRIKDLYKCCGANHGRDTLLNRIEYRRHPILPWI